MSRVLVTYATKHGSTREVAEAVAAELRELGADVDVCAADAVENVESYESVIVGGSLYTGRWHKDAQRFLKRYHRQLAERHVGVFALGPRTLAETEVTESRKQLDAALATVPDVEPAAVAIFGGVVDPTQMHFPFNRMAASDARDWNAIRAWAGDFATG